MYSPSTVLVTLILLGLLGLKYQVLPSVALPAAAMGLQVVVLCRPQCPHPLALFHPP